MAITLTSRQQLILRHMVVDAEGWIQHAETKFGTEIATVMLEQKVTKYEADYDAKVAAGSYKDRLDRDIDAENMDSEKAKLQAIKDAR
jgi:hypothetical protein|tara:strand:+ start:353 stop:616 length:264 start_codon:yes stop_codon:yes gene_type:complete